MRLVRLAELDPAQVDAVRALYLEAFPPEERSPFETLYDEIFLVLLEEDRPLGLAVLRDLADTGWVFLRYFAVGARGQGTGARFWGLLRAAFPGHTRIVLDAEDPDEPGLSDADRALRRRRLGFYRRLGVDLPEVVGYAPPHDDGVPLALRLMVADLDREQTPPVTGADLRAVVEAVFEHRYAASPVPALVTSALARVAVWPPDLAPDDRYVLLADLDVAAYVDALVRRLGGPPRRVAESTLVMGIASRLWSLTVVPAARDGVLPDPADLVVREDAGAVVLGVREPTGRLDPSVADVRAAVLEVLTPLVEALPLSPRLLWGNVAASLHAVPRVHALPAARPWVEALLAEPPLAGELDVRADGSARRRTCCLFYEVPGAGLCGDCVFDEAPGTALDQPGDPAPVVEEGR